MGNLQNNIYKTDKIIYNNDRIKDERGVVMIYTVTFNPAIDYVMKVKNLQTSGINRCDSEEIIFGGKGINVSTVLTRLGVQNTALGFIAGFSGRQLEAMLSDENIVSDFIYLKSGFTRINVKIRCDTELDFNAQGPDIDENAFKLLLAKLDVLKKDDYLVLAGSIPKSLGDDAYERILDSVKDSGAHFVVDATGDLLLNVLKYKPFLIKPNHYELGDLFGVELNDTDEIVKYAGLLQDKGAKNVLVSCGKKGAVLLCENGKVYKIGNVAGKIVSSVGCGDSMVAGFIAGYIDKNDYKYALRLGAACGNATAFSDSLATRDEIEKMMNNEHLV